MSTPTALGGGLRSPLMIDETSWNTGKIFLKSGIVAARCFQRVGTSYTLTVSGYYSGTTTKVQVRIVDAVTLATVVDWADLDAAPANNAFTGTVSVPQGNLDGSFLYSVQVRKTDTPSVITTSYSVVVIGIGILMIGQSNTEKLFGQKQTPLFAASPGVYRYSGGAFTGWYLNDTPTQLDEPTSTNGLDGFAGSGSSALGNAVAATTRVPVFMLELAIGATLIATWQTAANGGTHTSWDNLLTQLGRAIATGYGFEIVYWQQGETDGVSGTAKATYKTGITNVFNQCLALSGRSHIVFILGLLSNDGSGTDAHADAISQGVLEWYDGVRSGSIVLNDAAAANTLDLSSYRDQQATVDPHFTTPVYIIFGYRGAQAILYRMGLASVGMSGPFFAGTLTASAATQTITLPITQDGGSALKDTTGGTAGTSLTGFRAFNGVVAKTISSTAFSGNNIVLTLAGGSFANGDTINVDYLYGGGATLPVYTNMVYDNLTVPNTGLGRPLQPTRGQITGTAGA